MADLMVTVKGIRSTYNNDLQERVEPMLEYIKALKDGLLIAGCVLSTLAISPVNMLAALSPKMLATDISHPQLRHRYDV
jgi:argininosuccinate lyase